jgi:hypothetical protein
VVERANQLARRAIPESHGISTHLLTRPTNDQHYLSPAEASSRGFTARETAPIETALVEMTGRTLVADVLEWMEEIEKANSGLPTSEGVKCQHSLLPRRTGEQISSWQALIGPNTPNCSPRNAWYGIIWSGGLG